MSKQQLLTVAILFSGGDAPGMNALLRVFVRLAHKRFGARVLGIKDGYAGLVRTARRWAEKKSAIRQIRTEIARCAGREGIRLRRQDLVLMDDLSVSSIIDRGGIILGSARCKEFQEREDVCAKVVLLLEALGVSRLVVVGGDGSLRGAAELAANSKLQVIGIPASIDNDFRLSEKCLGADTAVNTIVSCVRNVNDTARSHHRIMVLEIMGRHCGYLAQTAALAAGAEIVITPEHGPVKQDRLNGIAERLEAMMADGRGHAVVLVAEGVRLSRRPKAAPAEAVADFLNRYFADNRRLGRSVDIRHTVLGHLQRGGAPTAADRLLAADFAEAAWDRLAGPSPDSGVLGVVHGRIELQDYGSEPEDDRQAEIERVYRLQKHVSDHAITEKPRGTRPAPKKRRTPPKLTARK